MRQSQWKPNYGDMLVCAALPRQVKLGPTIRIGFGDTLREVEEMSRMTSPSLQRRYPLATICRLWGLSQATLHRQRLSIEPDRLGVR